MNNKTDKGNSVKRRRSLKLVTGGSLLGVGLQYWVTPVVSSVVLPAHAQATPPPPPDPKPDPVVARLSGVNAGRIGTVFTVDASASTGPAGATLQFAFQTANDCVLVSQSGSQAVIQRKLVAGTCTVSVTVSSGAESDTAQDSAPVNGGPPPPP